MRAPDNQLAHSKEWHLYGQNTAHGKITILLILTALCTYYIITCALATEIHIDNKEMVDRGTKTIEK